MSKFTKKSIRSRRPPRRTDPNYRKPSLSKMVLKSPMILLISVHEINTIEGNQRF